MEHAVRCLICAIGPACPYHQVLLYDASFVQSDLLAPIIRYCCTIPHLCSRTCLPLLSGIVVRCLICAIGPACPYYQVLLYDPSFVQSDLLAPIIRYCCTMPHLCSRTCLPLLSGIVVRCLICAVGPACPYHQVLLYDASFVQSDLLAPIIRYCCQSDLLAPIIRYCCTMPHLCSRTCLPLLSGIVVRCLICAVRPACPYHQVLLYDASFVQSDLLSPINMSFCQH